MIGTGTGTVTEPRFSQVVVKGISVNELDTQNHWNMPSVTWSCSSQLKLENSFSCDILCKRHNGDRDVDWDGDVF